jgi:hypothetical protein
VSVSGYREVYLAVGAGACIGVSFSRGHDYFNHCLCLRIYAKKGNKRQGDEIGEESTGRIY